MKIIIGTVISDKMNKRVAVQIEKSSHHPMYGKIMVLKNKLHAVNEIGAKAGQKVKIVEIKPVSKTVNFKVVEILNNLEKK